jgi:hypothetical protein
LQLNALFGEAHVDALLAQTVALQTFPTIAFSLQYLSLAQATHRPAANRYPEAQAEAVAAVAQLVALASQGLIEQLPEGNKNRFAAHCLQVPSE